MTDAEIERAKWEYEEYGVTVVRGALDAGEVAAVQDAVEGVLQMKRLPPGSGWDYDVKKGRFFMGMFLWTFDETLRRALHESRLPGLAARMMGARQVNFFYDQLFVKEPGTENPTPWHHDQPYWAVKGEQVMSFWIALDQVTEETGAVEYVRGSHKWNRWFQPKSFAGENKYPINPELEPVPDIDARRADYDIVSYDMEPGDVLAFHGLTLHGSGGNRSSTRRRRGYAARYVGDDVTYAPRPETFKFIRDPGLQPGDRLDCDLFPVVHRA